MAIFFIGLTALMIYIVIQGIPKKQKYKTPTKQLLHKAIYHYLIRKVCQQFDLLESQLGNQVLNRIDGAAFKTVKPLLKDQEVYVQLPGLIEKRGEAGDFQAEVRFDDIRPYLKDGF